MLFENDPHDGFRWLDMQIWYLTEGMLREHISPLQPPTPGNHADKAHECGRKYSKPFKSFRRRPWSIKLSTSSLEQESEQESIHLYTMGWLRGRVQSKADI